MGRCRRLDTAVVAALMVASASLGTFGVLLVGKLAEARRAIRLRLLAEARAEVGGQVAVATQHQTETETAAEMFRRFAQEMRVMGDQERQKRTEADAKLDQMTNEMRRLRLIIVQLTMALKNQLPQMVASCPHHDPDCPGLRFSKSLDDVIDEAETAAV